MSRIAEIESASAPIIAPPSIAKSTLRSLKAMHNGSLPIYHQLYAALRQQIKDGIFGASGALPSEMTLCDTFGISRVSVRRALQMLEQEGLVVRRHGVGTFVAPRDDGMGTVRVGGMIDNLITLGLETKAEVLSFDGEAILPAFAAASLKLGAQDRGIRVERLRYYKGRPLSLTELYLPPKLSAIIKPGDIDDRPIIFVLEAAGLKAVSAEQTISAVVADDYVAAKLDVAIGSPLLRLRKTVFDQAGAPLTYQQGLYNPDQYEYYMLLTRDNNSNRPQWRHIG